MPSPIREIAGALAIVGLIAAFLFYVDARGAGLELGEVEVERERERADLDRRVRVPIAPIEQIDTIKIGVDAAAQDIMPGGEIPDYVPRNVAATYGGTSGERARRWVVERVHSWINRYRALLVRWSKKPINHEALLMFCFALIAWQQMGILK